MAQTAMTVRLDNQIKMKFDRLCEEFGMSANTAINVFVKAVIRHGGIPFSITAESNDLVREQAKIAFRDLRRLAVESTEPEMSLDEINEEIKAARLEALKEI
jgi:DNA-damage-inducible protein J